jgi:hypothetical protein
MVDIKDKGRLVLPAVEELGHVVCGVWSRGDLDEVSKLFVCKHSGQQAKHTVFVLLLTEKVWLCVIVVWTFGMGRCAVAMLTLLVGYNGFVLVAVILVGG